MTSPRQASGLNRIAAAALACIWLGAGAVALVLGIERGKAGTVMLAVLAIGYGLLWFRVAARSRLCTWRELAMPWRSDR